MSDQQTVHVSLGAPVRSSVACVGIIIAIIWGYYIFSTKKLHESPDANLLYLAAPIIFGALWTFLSNGIRVAAQWEKGGVMFFGKGARKKYRIEHNSVLYCTMP